MEIPLFTVTGTVEHGNRHAGDMGFPTANLPCPDDIPSGVFAGEMAWKGTVYPAAIHRDPERKIVEAHVLDFSEDLYGETVTFTGQIKIRDVKKFSDKKDLIAAIRKDIEDVRKVLQ